MTGGFMTMNTVPCLLILNLITDITVDCVSDAADHPITTAMQMNIEILIDAAPEGKTLLFKKLSSNEWKYNRIIEL